MRKVRPGCIYRATLDTTVLTQKKLRAGHNNNNDKMVPKSSDRQRDKKTVVDNEAGTQSMNTPGGLPHGIDSTS